MNCIRCAKETKDNHVFCEECRKDMERHPVKPGTPIQLPDRSNREAPKRATFRLANQKWERKIGNLRSTIFWLVVIIIILSVMLALCLCTMFHILPEWLDNLLGLSDLRAVVQSMT